MRGEAEEGEKEGVVCVCVCVCVKFHKFHKRRFMMYSCLSVVCGVQA